MRWTVAITMAVFAMSLAGGAQTTGAAGSASPTGAVVERPGGTGPGQAAIPDTRTEKQKALARNTERLFDMATELKVEVDKTNKNILSLKVVEKAEGIELLARGMKEQARR